MGRSQEGACGSVKSEDVRACARSQNHWMVDQQHISALFWRTKGSKSGWETRVLFRYCIRRQLDPSHLRRYGRAP